MRRAGLWTCAFIVMLICQVSFGGGSQSRPKNIEEEDEKSSMAVKDGDSASKKATPKKGTKDEATKDESQPIKPNSKECEHLAKVLSGGVGPASIVNKYLGPNGTEYFRATCKTMQRVMEKSPQEKAREKIRKMVGELKRVESGSFLMGSPEGEPTDSDNQPPHHVEIKEGYWLPVDDITVANYHYVMTGQWIEGGPEDAKIQEALKQEYRKKQDRKDNEKHGKDEKEEKKQTGGALKYPDPEFLVKNAKKPMRGLTEAQWDEFTKKLNEQVAKEWPIGYSKRYQDDGKKVPVFDWPEDYELEFATTIPLDKPIEVDNPGGSNKEAPKKVKITAMHSLFSGTNMQVKFDNGRLQGKDYEEVSKHVVCQKPWGDGPSNVDAVLPNERGFRNLTGNIWKQTKTPYQAGSVRRVLVGGDWSYNAEIARSASRFNWYPGAADPHVGFRPRAVPR